jgi:hypothetical protein
VHVWLDDGTKEGFKREGNREKKSSDSRIMKCADREISVFGFFHERKFINLRQVCQDDTIELR